MLYYNCKFDDAYVYPFTNYPQYCVYVCVLLMLCACFINEMYLIYKWFFSWQNVYQQLPGSRRFHVHSYTSAQRNKNVSTHNINSYLSLKLVSDIIFDRVTYLFIYLFNKCTDIFRFLVKRKIKHFIIFFIQHLGYCLILIRKTVESLCLRTIGYLINNRPIT